MTKQTVVEWLQDKLKETYDKEGKLPLGYTFELLKQAKVMEKEQIMDSFCSGSWYENQDIEKYAEEYFNETYK